MDLKEQLKRQIVANVIKDKCKTCARIFFDEALCTQDRVIRFETEFTRSLGTSKGYEVENKVSSLVISHNNKTWVLEDDGDTNQLFQKFEHFLSVDLPRYEAEKTKPEQLTEGEQIIAVSKKYERNPKARAECLAHHGTACIICGIDFEKAYGPEFAGKIEVHHIVPISRIGEEYVVDPIRDLVPVCPNCHTAIHSKKGGVYTIEEMQEIHNKQ